MDLSTPFRGPFTRCIILTVAAFILNQRMQHVQRPSFSEEDVGLNAAVRSFTLLSREMSAHAQLMCKSSYTDGFFRWKKFSVSGFESRQRSFISRSLGLSRRFIYVSWEKKHIHSSSFCRPILLQKIVPPCGPAQDVSGRNPRPET
jgi:hypothetical protein